MKNFVFVITALALYSASFAQVRGIPRPQRRVSHQQAAVTPSQKALANLGTESSTDCAFTFTTGKGNAFLNYCVSGNGNVVVLETPEGHPEVSSDKREGYGICDLNTEVAYSDYGGAGDSGNWRPATIVSHNATSVKIARTTSDGVWTLTQTFNLVSGNTPNVKVTMQITNNSSDDREALLLRYADVDADTAEPNELDSTVNSSFAYNSLELGDGAPFGLQLENLSGNNQRILFEGFAQDTAAPPDPCNFSANVVEPLVETDGSIGFVYLVGLLPKKSQTVIVDYKGL